MGAGVLVGAVVTLFGAIAGVALLVSQLMAQSMPQLGAQTVTLWIVFVVCFGVGIVCALMFANDAGDAMVMKLAGMFVLALGLTAGACALMRVLGILPVGETAGNGTLWALFASCLPLGILLMQSSPSGKPLDTASAK